MSRAGYGAGEAQCGAKCDRCRTLRASKRREFVFPDMSILSLEKQSDGRAIGDMVTDTNRLHTRPCIVTTPIGSIAQLRSITAFLSK